MLKCLAIFLLSLMTTKVSAEQLSAFLTPITNLPAGELTDGTVIAMGKLNYQGKHSGYFIQQREGGGNNSHSIVIHSLNNPSHLLILRVIGEGWISHPEKGVVILTEKDFAEYSLVVAGNQSVSADIWQINLLAGVLPAN